MNLKQQLDSIISAGISETAGIADCKALINYARDEKFGDYQANGIMGVAKQLGKNPREFGEQILDTLDLSGIAEKLELAGPGFINIHLANDFLSKALNTLIASGQLIQKTDKPQTVVVDYSSPNLAKEMHVGHMRGTIIGDALVRIFEHLGHIVIRQNHFGDWGTQFGMLITHMQDLHTADTSLKNELADLEMFYRQAKERFDSDADFANASRENVVKLQAGDAECLALWQEFINISMEHCEKLYTLLGITLSSNDIRAESFYNDKLAPVIADLETKGLLTESDGASCVFLEEFTSKDGTPLPVIVKKSDGGFLYATTDLAAIQYRNEILKADRVLYVVDARQSLHFQQVFKVAELAAYKKQSCSLEHLSYGTMMGSDGKPFKTRSGGTVKLLDLVNEGVTRAHTLVASKNPDMQDAEKQAIADVVGIAAIKYFELSKNRNSDYVFDWDTMLSFEGNTAPYLLYAYARIRSIFRKEEAANIDSFDITVNEKEEKALAIKLLQFTETVEQVAQDCFPNQLCLYLYELAGIYMRFYEACPVLKAQPAVKNSRLGLCQLTALTIREGLNLLGIDTLEKM
ncbi:MAG: arginine--tRNA ligase [Gammaproteobacteria bacterium]|nr:arginine--tRNA ligase [Gammaproteobacteria bacterium]